MKRGEVCRKSYAQRHAKRRRRGRKMGPFLFAERGKDLPGGIAGGKGHPRRRLLRQKMSKERRK